jgi:plastocyanin
MHVNRAFTRALHVLALAALWMVTASALIAAEAADSPQILIKDFMFAPAALSVKAGSTVSWRNQDNEPHTVASDSGLFRSGAIDTDEVFSFKFEQPGTYHFICTIHPYMVGTITAQ